MTRGEIKTILPIITAFAEGKTMEVKNVSGYWHEINDPVFDGRPESYRIKTEPKHRPFSNAEECWAEMQKHEQLGWVKFDDEKADGYIHIEAVRDNGLYFSSIHIGFEDVFKRYTFVDGSPFGIKEE